MFVCLFDGRTKSGSLRHTTDRSKFCPQPSLGVSPSRVCGSCYFRFSCQARRGPGAKRPGTENKVHTWIKKKKKKTPAGDPQIIPLSLYARLPSVVSSCLFQTPKNADIVVVGGRNNRDLVTLWKKVPKGNRLHPAGSSASLH